MKTGWFRPDKTSTFFCSCHNNIQNEEECTYTNYSAGINVLPMPIELCHIERTVNYGVWRDDIAVDIVAKLALTPQSSVVLDIDEDFFGCASGATPLVDVNIDWKSIDMLNDALERLFCPRQPTHESYSNHIMRSSIDYMIQHCHWSESNVCDNASNLIDILCTQLSLQWRKRRSAFCPRTTVILCDNWVEILNILATFTMPQLVALKELGFCLLNSLNTLPAAQSQCCIRVCHGYNIPNDTIVYLHSESHSEITARAKNLQKFFTVIDGIVKPRLVTIARSVRDGFTQRDDAAFVENVILKLLKAVFQHTKVIYDINLLGGIIGWFDRHQLNY